jgi:hypothetical protein
LFRGLHSSEPEVRAKAELVQCHTSRARRPSVLSFRSLAMTQLIAAKCPTCGAGLRIDPSAEFALCQYCSTSSFVRTKARPAPDRIVQERSPVIDVAGPRYGWLIGAAALVTLGGSLAIAAALVKDARSLQLPRTPAAESPPTASAPELTVARPSTSTPILGDGDPPVTAPESSASGPGRKLGSSSVPTRKAARGRVATGQITVSGRLDPVAIRAVVGGNTSRFRMCYEQGLGRTSTLAGRVVVRFVIGRDGGVSNVSDGGSDLADSATKGCVLSAFYGLSFPVPEGGIVTVTYPLIFRS